MWYNMLKLRKKEVAELVLVNTAGRGVLKILYNFPVGIATCGSRTVVAEERNMAVARHWQPPLQLNGRQASGNGHVTYILRALHA